MFVADVSDTFNPAQLSIQASYFQAAIGGARNTSLPVTFRQVGSQTCSILTKDNEGAEIPFCNTVLEWYKLCWDLHAYPA